ncbi:MAG: hypothetical protein ACREFY_13580 [Acetobacteraceae bacterium]
MTPTRSHADAATDRHHAGLGGNAPTIEPVSSGNPAIRQCTVAKPIPDADIGRPIM